MYAMEHEDKPEHVANVLWLNPNTQASETIRCSAKNQHQPHFVILPYKFRLVLSSSNQKAKFCPGVTFWNNTVFAKEWKGYGL